MSAPVFTCPFLPVQTKMQPRRLWGCLWGTVRMHAINIAKLGDFKMTTSVDVVWVIAANRKCCCQHAPKMRALTPLQRGGASTLAVNLLRGGRHAHSVPRKRSVLFQIREQGCFTHFLWCGPIHRSSSISLNPPLPTAHLQPS